MKFLRDVLRNVDTLWSLITIPAFIIFFTLLIFFLPLLVVFIYIMIVWYNMSLASVFNNMYLEGRRRYHLKYAMNKIVIVIAATIGFIATFWFAISATIAYETNCNFDGMLPLTLSEILKFFGVIC